MNIESLIEERTYQIDPNVSDKWIWPKEDKGAWKGPIINWERNHSQDYFKHVKQYNVVVTAGANCGLHARVFANRFKHVYAFEPEWLNFYCLTRNCPENNVYKLQAGLSNYNGMCGVINYDPTNTGTAKISKDGYIPVFTIDSLNLHCCDLIQLDVEQHEERVILGALKTIKDFLPVISIETITEKIDNFLREFGYVFDETSGHDRIFYHPEKEIIL